MASIRDVAKMAGVSAASVSRILNDDTTFSINDETRKRVIQIANRLHYSKTKGTHGSKYTNRMTIGLILRQSQETEVHDPYFQEIHSGIESEAGKWRMRVVNPFSMHDPVKNWDQLSEFAAVIMVGEMTPDAIQKIKNKNANLILVDSYSKNSNYDCIQTDFRDKTVEILNLLYDRGHRNIAFIGGKSSTVAADGHTVKSDHEIRADSYIIWMKLHNLDRYCKAKLGDWSPETSLKFTEEFLNQANPPTAIVVASDPMAMGVYKAINNAGRKIPEDVSIVSFDDVEMNRYLSPTLSSVHMEAKEMGEIAVKLARDRIIEPHKMPLCIVCSSELRIRESIKKII